MNVCVFKNKRNWYVLNTHSLRQRQCYEETVLKFDVNADAECEWTFALGESRPGLFVYHQSAASETCVKTDLGAI